MKDEKDIKIEQLSDCINDLTLTIELYMLDYPFDEHHKIKQQRMVDRACDLIGKAKNMNELIQMVEKSKQEREATKI